MTNGTAVAGGAAGGIGGAALCSPGGPVAMLCGAAGAVGGGIGGGIAGEYAADQIFGKLGE